MNAPTKLLFDPDALVIHPVAAEWPMIEGEEFDALCDSITRQGILVPIAVMLRDGVTYIIDGRNRYLAAKSVGHKFVVANFTILPGDTDVEDYVYAANGQRRQMSDEKKAELVERKLRDRWDMPDRAIGRLMRCSHVTVGKIRTKMKKTYEDFRATWDALPAHHQREFVTDRREGLSKLINKQDPTIPA